MANPRAAAQAAPGRLERVRTLLNTWLIPNDTRIPEDRFAGWSRRSGAAPAEAARLRALRDDLRGAVEEPKSAARRLGRWIALLDFRPSPGPDGLHWRHDGSRAAGLLASVMDACADGTWPRLKACPDCRWVFFDHTRSATKRWCLMNAGPTGRACGTIAKVRRFRERRRQPSLRGEERHRN
jgi:hypothetical protein